MVYDHREELKENGKLSFKFGPTTGFFDDITKRKFDYRLEIVTPGFLVNESHFERGIDPKEYLGIGKSFAVLKPGSILKPKKEIWVGPRTNFTSGTGLKIWEESYVVVIDSERTPGGKLKVWYYQTWDYPEAETVRNNILIYSRRNQSMTGSERQFQNRFEIVKI